MKKLIVLGLTLLLPGLAWAQYIDIRISVKVIVSAQGERPSGIDRSTFERAVEAANRWRAAYQRGYRYRLTEFVLIGGPDEGGPNGPSKWFGKSFRTGSDWTAFYAEAQSDWRYRLRFDQVNVWVATGYSGNAGGAMPIPPGEASILGGQIFADDGPWWILHELGHFFGLRHTFEGEDRDHCIPGDDGLSDTLTDSRCWQSQDAVAWYHYVKPYDQLTETQQQAVDNLYFNAMSYHEAANKNTVENRRTEQQLDVETDHANGDRHAFVSGTTRFVDRNNFTPFEWGTSALPYRKVATGVAAANASGGDIVLIRPGNYNEQLTINKPVTLRAPRTGWATIGKP